MESYQDFYARQKAKSIPMGIAFQTKNGQILPSKDPVEAQKLMAAFAPKPQAKPEDKSVPFWEREGYKNPMGGAKVPMGVAFRTVGGQVVPSRDPAEAARLTALTAPKNAAGDKAEKFLNRVAPNWEEAERKRQEAMRQAVDSAQLIQQARKEGTLLM